MITQEEEFEKRKRELERSRNVLNYAQNASVGMQAVPTNSGVTISPGAPLALNSNEASENSDKEKLGNVADGLIESAPEIISYIAQSNQDDQQSKEEAEDYKKDLKTQGAITGLKTGAAAGSALGPVGTAVGAIVGGIGGALFGQAKGNKAINKYIDEQGKELIADAEEEEKQRLLNYYNSVDSKRMEADYALLKKQNGLFS